MGNNKKFDYATLNAEQIFRYMEEHATEEQKKDFKSKAFVETVKKKGVPDVDENGNPIMYTVKDKDGNDKLDKNGKPILRKRIKMIDDESGEKIISFSLLEGKKWFKEHFPDAVIIKENKKQAASLFANW